MTKECVQEEEDGEAGSTIGTCPHEQIELTENGFRINCETCRYYKERDDT